MTSRMGYLPVARVAPEQKIKNRSAKILAENKISHEEQQQISHRGPSGLIYEVA